MKSVEIDSHLLLVIFGALALVKYIQLKAFSNL